MNRRIALKQLGILTGGMVLLPSCNFSQEKISLAHNKLQITVKQEVLLQDIVSAFIPEGEIPGARSLEVYNFVWVMVGDCMEKERQISFLRGLNLFDAAVEEIEGEPFSELNEKKQISVLRQLVEIDVLKEKDAPGKNTEDIQNFINTSKYYTVWGFMQSKYIMTEIMPYQLVPGTYGNCETIDKNKRINVNG